MHPRDLSIKDFNYDLPPERIAFYPLPNRDDSKLLIYNKGNIEQDVYRNITDHIPENSLLIFNSSKVVQARILFQKQSGGQIEIFCLEPHEQYGDINLAMQAQGEVLWQCLVGGFSKWKRGQVLEKIVTTKDSTIILKARFVEKRPDCFIISLSWHPGSISFAELLHHSGAVPLPPYIHREPEQSDQERYQTIYAKQDGSVAAPTAGLHFTPAIFEGFRNKNIAHEFISLHVGAGTFKPVKSETLSEHHMHSEFFDVSALTIEKIIAHLGGNIIAVGTTSLRTIESLYWMGVKLLLKKGAGSFAAAELPTIDQWEVYEYQQEEIEPRLALQALVDWMQEHKQDRLVARTEILIAPGYKSRIPTALITNFHQPQSTLLLLIAALIGNDWKKVYAYAMENEFRFLSYGDGSLIWIDKS